MGVQTRLVVTDDYEDGKELPESTEPILLVVGDRQWDLYLSDKSEAALHKALEKFTRGEPKPFKPVVQGKASGSRRQSSSTGRDKEQVKAVREYLTGIGWTHNDKPLSARGRIPEAGYEKYQEDHA